MSRGAHDFPPPPFCKCNKFVNIGDASCVGFHAHLFRDELLVELGFVNILHKTFQPQWLANTPSIPRVVVMADPHVQVHEPTLVLLSACTTYNLCSFVQASSGSIYLSCGLRGACGSHLPHWSTRPQKHLDSSSWLSSSPGQSCPPKTAPTTNRQLKT